MSSAVVGSGDIGVCWEGLPERTLSTGPRTIQSQLGQCAHFEKGLRKESVVGLPEACSLRDFFFFSAMSQ